ncbi:MAG: hypothetical protein INR71_05350 [Terriglobus roseus]|nr:hypothetical protein [Terriglobus roseus]
MRANRYEEELNRLRQELERAGGHVPPSHIGGPPNAGPSQPPPPALGHGPSNLFGGIMTGATAQGGPGLAPPPQDAVQQQGLPTHISQGPPGLNPAPTGPPQPPPFPYNQPGPPGPNGTYNPRA